MNAFHKVAWTEFIVSGLALFAMLILYPLIGDHAIGALWLLFLLCIAVFFKLGKKGEVISDERDREIELRSSLYGYSTAWGFVTICLLSIAMWCTWSGHQVPTKYCLALVYVQFAIFFGTKGAYSVIYYRSRQGAT